MVNLINGFEILIACSLVVLHLAIKAKIPARAKAHGVALITVSVALSQTPDKSTRPRTRASTSRGVPVYLAAFAGTKLYCLVTEAVGV